MTATPTIGRIVHYKLSEGDVSAIRAASPPMKRNSVEAGETYPAMIVRVFAEGVPSVNLQVLLDGDGSYWATSRPEGDAPGSWAWPARTA